MDIKANDEVKLERAIVEFLDTFNMKHSIDGFGYLIIAIKGKLSGEYSKNMSDMYADIASKNGVTASSVERAMRYAINISSTKCNKEFIAVAVDEIKYKQYNFN